MASKDSEAGPSSARTTELGARPEGRGLLQLVLDLSIIRTEHRFINILLQLFK